MDNGKKTSFRNLPGQQTLKCQVRSRGEKGALIDWAASTTNGRPPFIQGAAHTAFELKSSYEAKMPRAT